jgi:hypothetical protein
MTTRTNRSLVTLAAVAVLALGGGVPAALASHGADDPVSHDVRDDHGGKRVSARGAKHGADDGVRHKHHRKHHRHGNDDGPNHT